ncbi:phosphotransferase [Phytohabitans rumicis]|uniref:phosphotransferase n=1 Tax=Phytohabitans rumicis TaxID=1076125 RepID=UPI003530914D
MAVDRGGRGPRTVRTHPVPHPRTGRVGCPRGGLPAAVVGADLAARRRGHRRRPGESEAFAHDLAEFIGGVRGIDTRGRTFRGGGRGGDLRAHDTWMETCFERSERFLDVPLLRRMWTVLRDLPRGPVPDLMTHGDLIPGNVLVSRGRLAGVLDVGGLRAADPALDLVGAWHLLEDRPRRALRADLGCDDLEWERGKAWAFQQSMGAVWYYHESNPPMSRMGTRTLARLAAA